MKQRSSPSSSRSPSPSISSSEREELVEDLELLLAYHQLNKLDDLIDSMLRFPTIPSLGSMAFPNSPAMTMAYDLLFEDEEEEMLTMLGYLASQKALRSSSRGSSSSPSNHYESNLARLFEGMRDHEFKRSARMSKFSFISILNRIIDHDVFQTSDSDDHDRYTQLPISHQLAVTLERLGHRSTTGKFSENLGLDRRQVIKASRRVIRALLSLAKEYVSWPDESRRREISNRMGFDGFEGCVGCLEGTTIPMALPPLFDSRSYLDQDRRFSINMQVISDPDQSILSFHAGSPGSSTHGSVFKRMILSQIPDKFFGPGQYLLGNSDYDLTKNLITPYKSADSKLDTHREFNYCLTRAGGSSKRAIKTLKARWSSLNEMRLPLEGNRHMKQYINWIYACVILHNMLIKSDDRWDTSGVGYDEQSDIDVSSCDDDIEMPEPDEFSAVAYATCHQPEEELFRDTLRLKCLEINYSKRVLPITSTSTSIS